MPLYPASYPAFFDIRNYGAKVNGVNDDTSGITSAISAASSAGGGFVLVPGICQISSPLTLSTAGVHLVGTGNGSLIRPTAGFSGAQIINITASYCGVRDLGVAFANTTYTGNPAATGIQITAAQNVLVQNVNFSYINGWIIQSQSTSGGQAQRSKWTKFDNVFSTLCAKGIHIQGVAGNPNAAHVVTNCILDQVANAASSTGDGYFIEDSIDIELSNLECNISQGSGVSFHIKGACGSIHAVNFVGGGDQQFTTGPGVLIESGPNGTPSLIEFSQAIVETANDGIVISAGSEIGLTDCRIETNQFNGINITGGDTIVIKGCSFNAQNQFTGSNRFDITSSTSGNVIIAQCSFLTPSGTTAGHTTASITVSGGHVMVFECIFLSAVPFSGLPQVIRSCLGYNPIGRLSSQPAIPSTGVAYTNVNAVDCTVFVTGGTVSTIQIGGATTGLTSGTFRVPASQTITLNYTVSPTWVWFGD